LRRLSRHDGGPFEGAMSDKARIKKREYEFKSPAQVRAIALDLRRRLGVEKQLSPDLWILLRKFSQLYPHFKWKTVADSDLPYVEAIRRITYPNDAGGGPILRRNLEEILGLMFLPAT
jgi:hypothetical protein